MKKVINSSKVPAPIGPYSQGVVLGNILFTSGQIALDATTGKLILDDIKSETKKVMSNLLEILLEAGTDFNSVIKTTIFLKNMDDFAAVNEVYATYFTSDFPARETVQVAKLPMDVNVEISMVVETYEKNSIQMHS